MPPAVLIGVEELSERLDATVVLDASWIFGPFNHAGIDVRQRYANGHIPGSWFVNLEDLSDPAARLDPRVYALTPPKEHVLRAVVSRTGARAGSLIVVTDMDGGCTTAPFARHALLQAGCADVRLLDGGTPAWAAESTVGLTGEQPRFLDRRALPATSAHLGTAARTIFLDHEGFMEALRGPGGAQILDCRMGPTNADILPADYAALAVPVSAFVPPGSVLDASGAGARFATAASLRATFRQAGLDPSRPKVTSCYFGLGASVVATALEIAGEGAVRVHAGSLVEYAVRIGLVRPPAAPA